MPIRLPKPSRLSAKDTSSSAVVKSFACLFMPAKCSSVWLTTAHMDERHAPNMPKPINKLYATLSVG